MTSFSTWFASIAAVATCALMFAPNALARGAYDGQWSVAISGNSGNCDGLSYQYNIEIINSVVRYSGGDANISGNVGPSGNLSVQVSSNGNSAAGSGHLNGRSGSGRFHGRSASGSCGGTWSATHN